MRRSSRSREGQFRILEVVFASIIITASYGLTTYLISPANTPAIRGKADIETLGFNLLTQLAASGTLEKTANSGIANWEEDVKIVMIRLLPPATYFNLTIFRASSGQQGVQYTLHNTKPITNVQASEAVQAFKRAPEVASSTYVYTTKDGKTFVLILRLAHAGEIAQ